MPKHEVIVKVDDQINLCKPELSMAGELFKTIDRNRDYLKKWLIWTEDTRSEADSKRFLKMARLFHIGGQRFNTMIYYEDRLVGSIAFVKLDKANKKGEIGYWLSEDFQGKGIVTRSCRGLISYAFQHMDLNRIEIRLAHENTKSEAIPRKLGFRHEGTLRDSRIINGKYFDSEIYGLLKREWVEGQKGS